MKPTYYSAILLVGSLNLSWAPARHMGLLTDDYGIVTRQDLVEEEERCPSLKPFPPEDGSCFQYWQCLPTRDIFIECNDITAKFDGEDTAAPVFWIKSESDIHHYLTRRNLDMEACQEWKAEWAAVLAGESVICLSGEFAGTEETDDHPSSPPGTHHYWIIDQMKSHHSEWSYFYRDPETHSPVEY